jgi:hypothetical protein
MTSNVIKEPGVSMKELPMDTFALTSALLLVLLGCAGFYLSARHQSWQTRPLPARPARLLSSALLLASLYALTRTMNTVPAVFTFVVWSMVLLVAFPYLGAVLSRAPRGR